MFNNQFKPYIYKKESPLQDKPKVSRFVNPRGCLGRQPRETKDIPIGYQDREAIPIQDRNSFTPWGNQIMVLLVTCFLLGVFSFLAGRLTANPPTVKSMAAKSQDNVLTLAAPTGMTMSAQDYLAKAGQVFEEAKKLSQNKNLSNEDRLKIQNLINLALQTLSDGIAKYPNDASLYFERGNIYLAISQNSPETRAKARLDLEKALEIAPNDVNILATYGKFLVSEDKNQAKVIFNKLLSLLPKDSKDYQVVASWISSLEPTPTPTLSPTPTPGESLEATPGVTKEEVTSEKSPSGPPSEVKEAEEATKSAEPETEEDKEESPEESSPSGTLETNS